MKRTVDVHTGEIMAGNEETVLKSDTNSGCMVFVAYDSVKKIGGLAHSMLLSGSFKDKWHNDFLCDANRAIDEMIDDMSLLGSAKSDIEVCLVTEENVPHEKEDPEYLANINSAMDIIKQKELRVSDKVARDIGDAHVKLDVETGAVFCE